MITKGPLSVQTWGKRLDMLPELRAGLVENRSVTLEVRDSAGRPRAGVELVLLRGDAPATTVERYPVGVSDAQGRAVVQRLRTYDNGTKLWLQARGALIETEPIPLDAKKPPSEPVVIALPPTGSVRVRVVDQLGAPVAEPLSVSVAPAGTGDGDRTFLARQRTTEALTEKHNGEIVFPLVAAGRRLRVGAALGAAGSSVEIDGPGQPGAEVVAVVRLDPAVALVGRALDEKGRPLRHARLRLQFRTAAQAGGGSNHAESDAEGRFHVGLPKSFAGHSIACSIVTLEGSGLAAHLKTPLLLAIGDVPVGDLAFRLDPLIVAGKVVCRGAPGHCPLLAVEARGRGGWVEAGLANVIWLEGGKFEIRGQLEALQDAELQLSTRGFGKAVSVPFELGQKDLVVELEVVLPGR